MLDAQSSSHNFPYFSDLFVGCLQRPADSVASEAANQKQEQPEQDDDRTRGKNPGKGAATDNRHRQGRGNGDGGNSAATDAGTITNLMSDDAFNVMAFVKIAHYVWAIPLKVKGGVYYIVSSQWGCEHVSIFHYPVKGPIFGFWISIIRIIFLSLPSTF